MTRPEQAICALADVARGEDALFVIRFDLPDDADQEQVEAYLASLHESARAGARQLIEQGAPPETVQEYVAGVQAQLEAEEAAEIEEDEAPAG